MRPLLLLIGLMLLTAASQPAQAAKPALQATQFGVVGDGTTLNTLALQKLIDTCSAQGGGVVSLPAGRYLTGTIQLKDGVKLRLEAGATLLGSPNAADYRNLDPFVAGDGISLGYALIIALDAKNVGLEGPGAIDGQGQAIKAAQNPYTVRPFLMRWIRCSDVKVNDVHLSHPGAWTMHFFQSKGVNVSGVTIRSRGLMNNDGIDIDSCETVRVSNCDIDSGDDAICLKATSPLPCRDVEVSNCRLKTSCNAIKLGTESLGDFQNIRISNCQIRDTGMAGIALYCVDGAHLREVSLSNISMDGITVPLSIRLGARLKTFRVGDVPKPPGLLRDISIKNVRASGARQIGMLINGIPGHQIENLSLENIDIEVVGGGKIEDAAIKFPEKEAAYPEMLMFGRRMPVFGAYTRHIKGLK
ncbi:MAG TPA: glycosyl hydrolase family 28 protein, partial [Abditibacterium sp.]